uniref:Variant surface glycoprotein 596 n=1 Tax=Trypanosoma brucei TaxID=5691 RepID=M4SYG8_9TRYP|nr:variant surface glycoprotein 596 [Trypanosoma brucei]
MLTVLPIFVLVATCLQKVVKLAEMSGAKSAAAVKTPCDEIYFNQALAGKLKGQISLQQIAIANIRTEARQLWLGALAQNSPQKKAAYYVLAAAAEQEALNAEETNTPTVRVYEEAIGSLEKRVPQLQMFQRLLPTEPAKLSGSAAGGNGDNTFGASTNLCTVKADFVAPTGAACQPSASEGGDTKLAGDELDTLTELNGLDDAKLSLTQLTVQIVSKGDYACQTHNHANDNSFCAETATIASVTTGVGIKNLAAAAAVTQGQAQKIKTGSECGKKPETLKDGTVYRAVLAYTICQCQNKKLAIPQLISSTTTKTLISKPDIQKVALLATGKADKVKAGSDEARTAAAALFGGEETDLKKEFFDPLQEDSLIIRVPDNSKAISIKTASGNQNFADALAFLTGEAAKARVQTMPAAAVDKPHTQGCATKGENDCNNNPGCKYNEKDSKCEEDHAKALEGTTNTNTTGRNSFLLTRPLFFLQFLFLG